MPFSTRACLVPGLLLILGATALQTYPVRRVIDGDTVVLGTLGTVRLIGVDTPETVDPRKPVERFGREASAFLTELLRDQVVRVEYDQVRTDKYQRTLAYLYLKDGTLVNQRIIEHGYGHAYTEFPFRFMDEFRQAELSARLAKRGLWADAPPIDKVTNPVVLVNRTGSVYHRPGCRELTPGHYQRPLSDLPLKMMPCKVCKPPAR